MNRLGLVISIGAVLAGSLAEKGLGQASNGNENDVEVLTRGPLHEALAQPVQPNPQPGTIVPRRPPATIEELPPEEKPVGKHVLWIPGYWYWSDDREDFVWVSGLWRAVPPGRIWVAGYWGEAPNGWQWTPGFWTKADQEEVEYLPQPPESLENGPAGNAPSAQHFWVPGCWQHRNARYLWRPGYWSVVRTNWCWIPAHYLWCPSGYIFVDGYWDYLFADRGLCFAPIFFNQPVFQQAQFVYRPQIVLNTGVIGVHLFARPGYCHYFFGDYYGNSYLQVGYRPWYWSVVGGQAHSWDPFFHYCRRYFGRYDRDWGNRFRHHYHYFRDHEDARPETTYVRSLSSTRLPRRPAVDQPEKGFDVIRQAPMAIPLNQVVKNSETLRDITLQESARTAGDDWLQRRNNTRFSPVSGQAIDQVLRDAERVRDLSQIRRRHERGGAIVTRGGTPTNDRTDLDTPRSRGGQPIQHGHATVPHESLRIIESETARAAAMAHAARGRQPRGNSGQADDGPSREDFGGAEGRRFPDDRSRPFSTRPFSDTLRENLSGPRQGNLPGDARPLGPRQTMPQGPNWGYPQNPTHRPPGLPTEGDRRFQELERRRSELHFPRPDRSNQLPRTFESRPPASHGFERPFQRSFERPAPGGSRAPEMLRRPSESGRMVQPGPRPQFEHRQPQRGRPDR